MRPIFILSAVLALCACAQGPTVTRNAPSEAYTPGRIAPDGAAPGTCWDKTESPAVVKTVTEDILVQPAQISATGTVQSAPIYRSQTRQVIVQERQERWYQVLCDADLTAEFVSSVQRGLKIRGVYSGSVTGQIDAATRGAIRRYQVQEEIDTPRPGLLTVEAAKRLGLWTVGSTDKS